MASLEPMQNLKPMKLTMRLLRRTKRKTRKKMMTRTWKKNWTKKNWTRMRTSKKTRQAHRPNSLYVCWHDSITLPGPPSRSIPTCRSLWSTMAQE